MPITSKLERESFILNCFWYLCYNYLFYIINRRSTNLSKKKKESPEDHSSFESDSRDSDGVDLSDSSTGLESPSLTVYVGGTQEEEDGALLLAATEEGATSHHFFYIESGELTPIVRLPGLSTPHRASSPKPNVLKRKLHDDLNDSSMSCNNSTIVLVFNYIKVMILIIY